MTTDTHPLETRRYSLPALWHLLSLDAPTVAALWFTLAARTAHLPFHAEDIAALALGTWMLYAIDRMLDARHSEIHLQEERHRFHGVNQIFFLGAMACATPILLAFLAHMEPRLLHAYLLLGSVLAAYFALIHTGTFAQQIPKELAVGVIFVAAIFMPEFLADTHVLLPALCFGTLCWLNCTLIYQREHSNLSDAHGSTRFAIRHTLFLLAALAAASVVLLFSGEAFRALGLSVLGSVFALAILRLRQHRMGRLPFRIAADAALLTPLVFFLR